MSGAQTGRALLTQQLMRGRKKFKPQLVEAEKIKRWKIVTGDRVQVIGNHPEKGKQGIVSQMNRKAARVTVEGLNMRPFRIKGNESRATKGRTIMKERSIHYSNLNLVDPVTGLPTRIEYKFLENGTKVRVAKKSGAIIPKPARGTRPPVDQTVTDKCTDDADEVWKVTYMQKNRMQGTEA